MFKQVSICAKRWKSFLIGGINKPAFKHFKLEKRDQIIKRTDLCLEKLRNLTLSIFGRPVFNAQKYHWCMCLVLVCFPLFQMLKYKGFQKNNNYKTNANIFQFSLILNQRPVLWRVRTAISWGIIMDRSILTWHCRTWCFYKCRKLVT